MDYLKPLSNRLLAWWDAGHADLPWRRTTDPYAIWVAEIMLQQTQVPTVLPYYQRWMVRFPTVETLSAASLDEVLSLWQGLGYYSRVRNLHDSAQRVVHQLDGRVPDTVEGLLALPGIGRYTAGAIASIAFEKPVPVLDGNVIRVFSRLLDLEDDISLSGTKRQLWGVATRLMPQERPGEYNQALMELGQSVCLPQDPACHLCPVADLCLARQRGTQAERPVRPPRRKTPHYDVTAAIIWRDDGRFLIARRPLEGMLGGLWEFPGGKREDGEELPQALYREIKEELALSIEVGPPLTTIRHAYTHFRITLYAFHARYLGGPPQNLGVTDHAWVTLAEVDDYPFAKTDRQIIEALLAQGGLSPFEISDISAH